jgi:hypothetical protein
MVRADYVLSSLHLALPVCDRFYRRRRYRQREVYRLDDQSRLRLAREE